MRKIARTFTPVNRSSDLPLVTPFDRGEATDDQRLTAANARLLALRQRVSRAKTEANAQPEPSNTPLPAHLGWGSARLLRLVDVRRAEATSAEISRSTIASPVVVTPQQPATGNASLSIHPELAEAFLKHDVTATARLWLLLRHLDTAGRGWIEVSAARRVLTDKGAALRVCGWRQLRNLLHAGNGLFWERDKDRVWLRSVAKVAARLDLARVNRPKTMAIETLVSGMHTVRAAFYALGHSQRGSRPISRAKLADITGISARTQRRYDHNASVAKTTNYCLGAPTHDRQSQAWHYRHAAFDFVDKQGQHGEAGRRYRAYQLPNSYSVTARSAANGRTRKINQQLRQDLVKNRAQGNSGEPVERGRNFGRKLFFDSGQQARKQSNDVYLKTRGGTKRTFWVHYA